MLCLPVRLWFFAAFICTCMCSHAMNIHWWSMLSGCSIGVLNSTLWTSFCAACGSWSWTACVPWICGHSLSHSCWSCSSCVCPCWFQFLLSQSDNTCCHMITAVSAIQWCPPILMSASPVGMLVCSKIVPQRWLSHPWWSWSQPRLAWLSHRSCNVLLHVALSCIGVCCQIDCSQSQSAFTSCSLAFVFSPNLMRVLQKLMKICCCFWCRHSIKCQCSSKALWHIGHSGSCMCCCLWRKWFNGNQSWIHFWMCLLLLDENHFIAVSIVLHWMDSQSVLVHVSFSLKCTQQSWVVATPHICSSSFLVATLPSINRWTLVVGNIGEGLSVLLACQLVGMQSGANLSQWMFNSASQLSGFAHPSLSWTGLQSWWPLMCWN